MQACLVADLILSSLRTSLWRVTQFEGMAQDLGNLGGESKGNIYIYIRKYCGLLPQYSITGALESPKTPQVLGPSIKLVYPPHTGSQTGQDEVCIIGLTAGLKTSLPHGGSQRVLTEEPGRPGGLGGPETS